MILFTYYNNNLNFEKIYLLLHSRYNNVVYSKFEMLPILQYKADMVLIGCLPSEKNTILKEINNAKIDKTKPFFLVSYESFPDKSLPYEFQYLNIQGFIECYFLENLYASIEHYFNYSLLDVR